MISGPFFIGSLVGVGWRLMVSDRVWAHSRAHCRRRQCVPIKHTLCYGGPVKYFAWDNAKNATLRPQCILFEDIVFHIERGDVVDVLRPAADLYAGQRIFVIQCGDRLYWCRSSKTSTQSS